MGQRRVQGRSRVVVRTQTMMASLLVLAVVSASALPVQAGPVSGTGFSDVPSGHVFAEDVAWLAASGVTEGRGDGTFGLGDAVTRGAMAAFLFRYHGEPDGPFDAPEFPDVPSGHVFAEPIAWLAETGVTEGRDDGTFGLSDPVTRGAMAAFLHRYDGQPEGPFDTADFPDVPDDHVFAEPIAWLASTGITQGRDDGTFGLNDAVTRGAMAAFLFRYDRQVAGSGADLAVSVERLPGARLGLSYAAGLEASGGVGPYRWEVSGLPEGLAADADGRIRGVAVEEGSWALAVEVTDQRGEQAAGEVVLEVADIGVPAECVGQDCAVLEPFDGSEVEIGGTTVDRTTFELEPGQVEVVTVDAPGQHEDDAVGVVEPGGVDGSAELRVFDLAAVPQLGDVLVVAASDHPPGHLGTLIVQAEQVEEVGDGTVEVAGVVVGLPSAYRSGVVHVRDGDGGAAGLAGLAGLAGSGAALLAQDAAPVACELEGGQQVSAEAAPWTDGDVYVEWRLGVPREVEVLLEAGIDVAAELAVSGELSCELSSLPAVTVPKGPVFFRLAPALSFEADGAVEGGFSASASCEAMFGYNRDEDASFDCTGDSDEVDLFDDLDADADARAEASLTAALEPSITMVDVVGVTGSLGAAISAHLTPLDQPRARIDLTAPTELGGCLGCDLPVVGTLLEDTFVEHTYGPTTIWALEEPGTPLPGVDADLADYRSGRWSDVEVDGGWHRVDYQGDADVAASLRVRRLPGWWTVAALADAFETGDSWFQGFAGVEVDHLEADPRFPDARRAVRISSTEISYAGPMLDVFLAVGDERRYLLDHGDHVAEVVWRSRDSSDEVTFAPGVVVDTAGETVTDSLRVTASGTAALPDPVDPRAVDWRSTTLEYRDQRDRGSGVSVTLTDGSFDAIAPDGRHLRLTLLDVGYGDATDDGNLEALLLLDSSRTEYPFVAVMAAQDQDTWRQLDFLHAMPDDTVRLVAANKWLFAVAGDDTAIEARFWSTFHEYFTGVG